jgi:hypothetical protein
MLRISIITVFLLSFYNLVNAQVTFPETKGWSKKNTEVYDVENLWEYIDGAADYYLNYGFVRLDVAEYQRSAEEYFKVEIYQHSSELNTFGIYAYERPSKTTFLMLGAEGYMEHSAINFYGKQWYVKIHTHQKDEDAIRAIKDIAQKVSGLLGENITPPTILQIFPKENLIGHSQKYYPTNFLGLSFLENAISADYQQGTDKYTLFVLEQVSKKLVQEMVLKYFEFVKTGDNLVDGKIYSIDDPFNGQVYILLKQNKLLGTVGLKDHKMADKCLEKLAGKAFTGN